MINLIASPIWLYGIIKVSQNYKLSFNFTFSCTEKLLFVFFLNILRIFCQSNRKCTTISLIWWTIALFFFFLSFTYASVLIKVIQRWKDTDETFYFIFAIIIHSLVTGIPSISLLFKIKTEKSSIRSEF